MHGAQEEQPAAAATERGWQARAAEEGAPAAERRAAALLANTDTQANCTVPLPHRINLLISRITPCTAATALLCLAALSGASPWGA